MRSGFKVLTRNEDGYALVVTMLLLVLMTAIGIAASHTSDIEVQISGNERNVATNFYTTESALIQTLENTGPWLTIPFVTAAQTAASYSGNVDVDGDAVPDALVEIRDVESTGTAIAALSAFANNVPADNHLGPPPVNSGYSLKYFQIRKYAVSATSTNGNTNVQTGVWKVFNVF